MYQCDIKPNFGIKFGVELKAEIGEAQMFLECKRKNIKRPGP